MTILQKMARAKHASYRQHIRITKWKLTQEQVSIYAAEQSLLVNDFMILRGKLLSGNCKIIGIPVEIV